MLLQIEKYGVLAYNYLVLCIISFLWGLLSLLFKGFIKYEHKDSKFSGFGSFAGTYTSTRKSDNNNIRGTGSFTSSRFSSF